MSLVLKQNDTTVAALSGIHWWLTAFCPGIFSDPEDLTMETSITFPDLCMAYAFRDALEKEGYDVCICGLKICFTFSDCKNCSFPACKNATADGSSGRTASYAVCFCGIPDHLTLP